MDKKVIVLGASGFVGDCVLQILAKEQFKVVALSRQADILKKNKPDNPLVQWQSFQDLSEYSDTSQENIELCLCVAPIWVLPEYFKLLQRCGVKRIVVLSSTSRFTKINSSVTKDKNIAQCLVKSESQFIKWAETHNIKWTIFRPTLIYRPGYDKNITEIARFIQKYGFFPLFGEAKGKRQPIHAMDVAAMCVSALSSEKAINKAYNISGGEIITYQEMVKRVFLSMNRRPLMIKVPMLVFKVAVSLLQKFPRYRHYSIGMAERMNSDQVFDASGAMADLGVTARGFNLPVEKK